MAVFRKGQRVCRVICVRDIRTASIQTVEWVRKGAVKLESDEHLRYRDIDGLEVDPVIPGCSSMIITLTSEDD